MIWKLWFAASVVVLAIAWVLMVPYSPPPRSLSATAIEGYRAEGVVPAKDAFRSSAAVPHSVFEMPESDARHRAEATAAMNEMPGMTMGEAGHDENAPGMAMEEEGHVREAPGMALEEEGHAREAPGMAMEEEGHGHEAPGMAMEEEGHAGAEPSGHGGGGPMVGISVHTAARMAMPAGKEGKMAGGEPGRTIEVTMREWGYQPGRITVKPGERLRLVVRNGGMIPHEFMVMAPPGMKALDYRVERADWNLTEHEAIFERPVVMPGDTFELDVTVHEPGVWMFMCMFPFHMRLGMMGLIMTEGSGGAMPMGHGDMKM